MTALDGERLHDIVDQLALGRLEGADLPSPLLYIWLRGWLDAYRLVEQAQDDARHYLMLLERQPFRSPTTFLELSRRRGDTDATARAEVQSQRNSAFGEEVGHSRGDAA